MKRIYEAANVVEAHMIVHMLDAAGIEAHVQGEHLQSGVGDLPMGGLVAVAVADDDADAARRVVKDWEARTRSPVEQTPASATSRTVPGQLIAFIVGGLIAGGIVWSLHHGPDSTSGMDWNGDGTIDERTYFDGETLDRIDFDRDFDGKVDAIQRFDLEGFVKRYEADDDFDGRFESITLYRDGQPIEFRIDADGDGRAEFRMQYESGVAQTGEYLDRSGNVVKRVRYRGPKPEIAELDLDANGTWERTYRFDRYDEPTDIKTSSN